jgi:hypothetical protein
MVKQFEEANRKLPQNETAPGWLEEGLFIGPIWVAAAVMLWGAIFAALYLSHRMRQQQLQTQLSGQEVGGV